MVRLGWVVPSSCLVAITGGAAAFSVVVPGRSILSSPSTSALFLAKAGKGFGSKPPPPAPKKKAAADEPVSVASNEETTLEVNQVNRDMRRQNNSGQTALEKLRREEAEKRDAELRKVGELRDVDASLRENPGNAAIPEKVANRMGKRMLPFVGIPLFGGMGAFVAFWYFATYRDLEFEPGAVAASTIAILVVGLVGITYSVMSASWDDDRDGSALGLDEFATNFNNIRSGLSRTKENAILREKMAGMPESQIQAALKDLDARDEAKKAAELKKDLSTKISNEMD